MPVARVPSIPNERGAIANTDLTPSREYVTLFRDLEAYLEEVDDSVFSARGVVADGLTDDSPALAAAYSAFLAAGGGTFQLPPGRIRTTQAWAIAKNAAVSSIRIKGAGMWATTIIPDTGVSIALTVSGALGSNPGGIILEDFGIDSATTGTLGDGNEAIRLTSASVVIVNRLAIGTYGGLARFSYGIHSISNSVDLSINDSLFVNCLRWGIYTEDAVDDFSGHRLHVERCVGRSCGSSAVGGFIYSRAALAAAIIENETTLCVTNFHLKAASLVGIHLNYFEEHTEHPCIFEGTNSKIDMTFNWFQGPALTDRTETTWTGVSDSIIAYNTFRNMSTGLDATCVNVSGWATNEWVTVPPHSTSQDLTGSPWNTPSFINSWAATSTVYGYHRHGNGTVELRGEVNGGAAGTAAFILPAGYRVKENIIVPAVYNDGTPTSVSLNANGEVAPNGNAHPVSISNICVKIN